MKQLTVVTVVAASLVVGVEGSSAFAATTTVRHDNIAISMPTSKSVYGSAKATIRPSVKVVAGPRKRAISKRILYVSQGARLVASGASAKLRAGTYLEKVAITYRRYWMVTKRHAVKIHHDMDFLDGVTCVVKEAANYPDIGDYFVVKADCTALQRRPGQLVHESYADTSTPGPYKVGQRIIANLVEFPAYTRTAMVRGPVKVFGKPIHYVTPRRTLVITKHTSSGGGGTGGGSSTCYPLTNSGNCYEPGEFCRNSDHGLHGVAGNGEAIVCEDNNGWRWEPA